MTARLKKRRDIVNAHIDSTIWDRFEYRSGDIVIANWGKSGCTWLQQIVCQLIFHGRDDISVADVSPWLELPFPSPAATLELLERQTHRRVIKTHLPIDALVTSPTARYIYVGRDGRDIAWSLFHHFRGLSDTWYDLMQQRRRYGPVPTSPPNDFGLFFRNWLQRDGYPWWPFWENVQSWWDVGHLPNVMIVHYLDLKENLRDTIARIARFLDVHIRPDDWASLLERASLEYMRANAKRMIRGDARVFRSGVESFFRSGESLGWRDVLTETDLELYDEAKTIFLSPSCAHWLDRAPTCEATRRSLASEPTGSDQR